MMIRAWHARLHTEHGVSASTAAKAYRLLRTIFATAVDDELLARNPCVLSGAGVERPIERPVLSLIEVEQLTYAIAPRYSAMVLMATWTGLRFGEAAGLKRGDLNLVDGLVRVERQLQELKLGGPVEGPPKTEAGRRTVSIPPHIIPELANHLARYLGVDATSHVFTSPDGTLLRRSNFNRRMWQPACLEAGIKGFRFHDLRHTGNTLAASTGASTRELMARMGHASPRAALIYQHATADRDRAVADALSQLAGARAQARPILRLVVDQESERYRSVTATPEVVEQGSSLGSERPDQRGGDDGTRTHDPLLAKLTAANVGERRGASGLMSGAPGAA
jgi:integrase